jgi:hypothetical protein
LPCHGDRRCSPFRGDAPWSPSQNFSRPACPSLISPAVTRDTEAPMYSHRSCRCHSS